MNFVLGGSGAAIKFTTTPNLTHGVLADTNNGATLGWATLNGSDFANYTAGVGVTAAGTILFGSSVTSTDNVLVNGSVNANTGSAGGNLTRQTYKMSGSGAGPFTLDITGAGSLNTTGFLLTGTADFTISSSGGGVISGTQNRYFYTDAGRTLTVSAGIGAGTGVASTNAVIKSGPGTMSLTNTGNSAVTADVAIDAGAVRVNGALSSLPNGELQLRGGVVEVDVTGGNASFNKTVQATGAGTVNWGNGGGGFAAYSSGSGGDSNALTVTLNSGNALTWGSSGFAPTGNPLIFGSATANRQVNFANPIDLGDAEREIQVNASTVARLDGALTAASLLDVQSGLVKTGGGTLILNNFNTYCGDTVVTAGTLQLAKGDNTLWNTANNGGDVYGELIANGGAVDLMGHNQQAGIVVVENGGVIQSTGNVTKALTGSAYDLRSGTVSAILAGAAVLTKTTADTVTLSGANTYTGATTVSAGTLALSTAGTNNLAGSATLTVAAGAALDVRGVGGAGGFTLADHQVLNGTGTVIGELTVGSGARRSRPATARGRCPRPAIRPGPAAVRISGRSTAGPARGERTAISSTSPAAWTSPRSEALTPADQFRIDITGLTAGNITGAVPGFDRTAAQSWIIATASTGIAHFDAGDFLLDTTGFAPANALGGGTFQLSVENESGAAQSLVLTFEPGLTPEPATGVILCWGGMLAWRRERRDRSRSCSSAPDGAAGCSHG